MTVRIYIWRGKIPFATVYNGVIFKKDAGHASMEIIDNVILLLIIAFITEFIKF